jgi:hypothetical protein
MLEFTLQGSQSQHVIGVRYEFIWSCVHLIGVL